MRKLLVVCIGLVVLAGAAFATYRLGLSGGFFGTAMPDAPVESTSPAGSQAPDNVTPGSAASSTTVAGDVAPRAAEQPRPLLQRRHLRQRSAHQPTRLPGRFRRASWQ